MNTIGKRAADFIRECDPFGDRFSQLELQELAGEPKHLPEFCPVCGGDCSSTNPPMMGCPMHDRAEA
jgi:hypothetical protein